MLTKSATGSRGCSNSRLRQLDGARLHDRRKVLLPARDRRRRVGKQRRRSAIPKQNARLSIQDIADEYGRSAFTAVDKPTGLD